MLTRAINEQRGPAGGAWADIAPANHAVQIYQRDDNLLEALEDFVSEGLRAGEGVIVIATAAHAGALDARLRAAGQDVDLARAEGRYQPLEAGATLARFMVNDWPNDEQFRLVVGEALARAYGAGRPIRAFGEMVAVLWGQGHHAATVRLEYLWNKCQEEHALRLFCAYPMSAFRQDAVASLFEICAQHSHALPG